MAVRFLAASVIGLAFLSQACHSGSNATPQTGVSPNVDVTSNSSGPSVKAPDPAQIALGEKIFHGQEANGTCAGCHGVKGRGTAAAPQLNDAKWIDSDGSLQSIIETIRTGVPQPKEHEAAMPPMGGSKLTEDQIQALGAYVYSLSHK